MNTKALDNLNIKWSEDDIKAAIADCGYEPDEHLVDVVGKYINEGFKEALIAHINEVLHDTAYAAIKAEFNNAISRAAKEPGWSKEKDWLYKVATNNDEDEYSPVEAALKEQRDRIFWIPVIKAELARGTAEYKVAAYIHDLYEEFEIFDDAKLADAAGISDEAWEKMENWYMVSMKRNPWLTSHRDGTTEPSKWAKDIQKREVKYVD